MRGWVAALAAAGSLAALTSAAPVPPTQTPSCTPGLHTGFVQGRPYKVYIPVGADSAAPTIVSYHGRLQRALSQVVVFQDVADAHGVVVVAPQARSGKWDFGGPDTAFTNRILDNLLCDDPGRTYASGMSMGSAMTFLQACAEPRRFAAFAGVGFEIYMPKCADPDPVPLLAFHGSADPVVPFIGGRTASTATAPDAITTMRQWARRDQCRQLVKSVFVPGVSLRTWDTCAGGKQVQFYTLHGGKHVWPKGRVDASSLMWEFFQQYRL